MQTRSPGNSMRRGGDGIQTSQRKAKARDGNSITGLLCYLACGDVPSAGVIFMNSRELRGIPKKSFVTLSSQLV